MSQEQEQEQKYVPISINALTDSNDPFFLFMDIIDSKKNGLTKTITKPKIKEPKIVKKGTFEYLMCSAIGCNMFYRSYFSVGDKYNNLCGRCFVSAPQTSAPAPAPAKLIEERFTHKRCCKCKRIFLFDNRSDCLYRYYCDYTCYTKHV